MANKTIRPDNRPTIQNGQDTSAHSVTEAVSACSLKVVENTRLSTTLLDALRALNAQLSELDHALEMAYG
jgi:hypothetical protein